MTATEEEGGAEVMAGGEKGCAAGAMDGGRVGLSADLSVAVDGGHRPERTGSEEGWVLMVGD